MKTSSTLQKTSGSIFRQFVKGDNFMTPTLLGYYKIADGEAELTRGQFLSNTMYGVTIVQHGRKDDDLSKCCHSFDEAIEYICSLQ